MFKFLFLGKIYIPSIAQILSVPFQKFWKFIHLHNPKSYQDTEN